VAWLSRFNYATFTDANLEKRWSIDGIENSFGVTGWDEMASNEIRCSSGKIGIPQARDSNSPLCCLSILVFRILGGLPKHYYQRVNAKQKMCLCQHCQLYKVWLWTLEAAFLAILLPAL
jgi:hypothetical protein